MSTLRVGIIGCGRPRETSGATGFGMAHWHALGYESAPETELVALADINLDNARAFQSEHGGDHLYDDYHDMLTRERLDIVSVCTWPGLHAGMVIAAADTGVGAVHCEKPMAPSLAEARAMVDACQRRGTQLTFNHQRRFGDQFRKARQILHSGEIGELVQMEGRCVNLFDWGTHWFDMFGSFNDEQPAAWVLGQIDSRGGREFFGVNVEGQGLSHIRYDNGVHAFLVTGHEADSRFQIRLTGTDGVIEIGHSAEEPLRYWGKSTGPWSSVPVADETPGVALTKLGIQDLVQALREHREPELSGHRALQATEAMFATYESSRQRKRIDLPFPASSLTISEFVECANQDA